MRGSMLRRTPACEAGTWVMPQFQSSVVVAVQSRPLAARASQALRRDAVDGRKAVGDGDVDREHDGAEGDAVGGDDDVVVALHEALVEEDPEEGDEEGEDDEEVAGEGWAAGGVVVGAAESDEGGAGGGEGESGPAERAEAFVRKDDWRRRRG